ncbi:L-alanine exporter AlaE [Endozoicomonas sp. SM1973]|uniref:L-alanine exporter AlaE n=1 Tax=Spartinivicinus marinus TaxID=2994442 RepID=A0A853I7U5_9GAMM|nr:L-alanine exporter AlaE [Spartinivicinus marinus]MCX4025260.1 L-alanine exporter AlaE [Spartinivicinus marinus]NYZ65981.1 L-alanine exporter AlaE [Spartinivicinus marinus]
MRYLLSKRSLADTFAFISFAFVTGLFFEIVVTGLSVEQSLQSRLVNIPVNLLIATPYGLFRDWIFKLFNAVDASQIKRSVVDTLAFILFHPTVYGFTLVLIGANPEQIVTACSVLIVASVFMARPYGIYLQFCRGLFKIEAVPSGAS